MSEELYYIEEDVENESSFFKTKISIVIVTGSSLWTEYIPPRNCRTLFSNI